MSRKRTDWPDSITLAYCWRSGVIGFGQFLPDGCLPILSSRDRTKLIETIQGNSRWSYPPQSVPLVPGIPEAQTDEEALERLHEFIERIRLAMDAPPVKPKRRRRRKAQSGTVPTAVQEGQQGESA